MFKFEWGPAQHGVCEEMMFETVEQMVDFANTLTDTGDWVVSVNDEFAYGETIAEALVDVCP